MLLPELIIRQIRKEGPLSFHDFMEMALYYPGSGYYTSAGDKIGAQGDFYTSSSLTPAFGAMIGKQIEEMWSAMGEETFTIVEYGAGAGCLCRDILGYLKNNSRLYDRLNYCIIEKSAVMKEKGRACPDEKISWHNSISDIGEINGCVLSNELVDNFPVHRVVMEDMLMEVFVDYRHDFVELLKPAGEALRDYFAELNIVLPGGFRTEINLEAIKWMKEVATFLRKGYVITIDYGYSSPELYQGHRSQGTMVCYHKHQVNDDPYHHIGDQDITSHVNFSALIHWGLKNGLHFSGLTNQGSFLLAMGFRDYLMETETAGEDIALTARKLAFVTHTLIFDMGTRFKVLIQEKGVSKESLTGLRLC